MISFYNFMNKNFRNEKGVALILILWVVILLSVIANTFAWMIRTEAQAVSNFQGETRAYYLARGGFQRIILELMKNKENLKQEAVEKWLKIDGRVNTISFIDGYAEVRVFDEGGKVDINAASRDDIMRILAAMNLDMEDKDVIADSILDWIDENNLHRLNGAEDDYYRSLSEPYGSKDAPFSTVDELLWVRGMTPEIFYNKAISQSANPELASLEGEDASSGEEIRFRNGLESIFTVFTSSNKVNINTAPLILISSLPGISEEMAKRIVALREESPFKDMGDLMGRVVFPPESGKFISFSPSGVYSIEIVGRLNGSHVRRSFKSVVKIKENSDYEIIYWKE
jgi:general secretion pathway protein K